MDSNAKTRFAELLRAAANQTISESDFWNTFDQLQFSKKDPTANLAYDVAVHYWGNFHARNLLFAPVKPDKYQLEQGRGKLNLLAQESRLST